MKRHHESHLDHALTEPQINYIFERFADRSAFFKETIDLPSELGDVPCALWGPAMGDPPILNGTEVVPLPPGEYIVSGRTVALDVIAFRAKHQGPSMFTGAITLRKRGTRSYQSRCIDLPMRPTRKVFVVGGPHENESCILYTAYGGPEAPQEPTDPNINPDKLAASIDFWRQHALSRHGS